MLIADAVSPSAEESLAGAGVIDEFAHAATGLIVIGALACPATAPIGLGVLAGSLLIDVDHIPGTLGDRWLTHGTPRPYPHSLPTLALLALVVLLVGPRRRPVVLGALIGLAVHFLRDAAEP